MKEPLVSVVLPTYNSEKTISSTLQSIKNQSYSNFEIIVIDDASSDRTLEIVEELRSAFYSLIIISKDTNKGVADSRNVGIANSTGEYIAFIDSDDRWLPEKIPTQISEMINRNVDFTYTHYYKKDIESEKPSGVQYSPSYITYKSTAIGNMIGCSTVVAKRELIKNVSIPLLKKRNDLALWLKFLKITGRGYLVDEILTEYYHVPNSLSSGPKYKLLKYHYQVYRESEEMPILKCFILCAANVFSNIYKKIRYSKEI